jgi:peptidoglycan/LPS O-acetylase OafA/YrhL
MKYIKGFDGLRCISILLVIITHAGLYHKLPDIPYIKRNVFYFFSGNAGVTIFFSISGFLITSLLLKEKEQSGNINLKRFFTKRFLRLVPPIIPFYIVIILFMQLGYISQAYLGLLASIFYVYNFIPNIRATFITELVHTWSLAIEEQFYLIWPFIISYFKKKEIFILSGIIIFLSIIALFLFPFVKFVYNGSVYFLNNLFFPSRWTIPAISPILIGALASLINFYHFEFISKKTKQRIYLLLGIIIFCGPFYLPTILFDSVRIFSAIGVSMILLWIYHNQGSQFVNILEYKPVRYIGKISYGLYIWQGLFMRTGPNIEPKLWIHVFPANIVLSFLVAIISFEFYEKKILDYKRKYIH